MKVGVIVPAASSDAEGGTPAWSQVRGFARRAEALGLDSVWMFDHFFYRPETGPIDGQLEAWTVVSAIAAVTERVEIGTLVLSASFRSPTLTAKMAVTADEVSGGRLILGLGAGWHDAEYDAFGFPKDHRAERFEEALEIVVPLLRGETVTFEGRYHVAHDAVLEPPPSRRIPILVAAFGPRMLRLTARHADAWNTAWFGAPDDRLRERMATLDAALEAERRDGTTLERTVGIEIRDPEHAAGMDDGEDDDRRFAGSVDELAEMLERYAALGLDHLIVVLQPMTVTSLERLASALGRG